ncbi:protocadherin-8-like [Hemiscyllium ocellatum]|uniref:protocadherin-8-like n=1 Tax=Hemiscyllium ocellatum TaxID=170820 RepID=UPI00296690FB|nr:protocadherin-8-like [Hemiscyllium ocellatum]
MSGGSGRVRVAVPVCSPSREPRCLLLLLLLAPILSECKTVRYSTYEEQEAGTVIGNLAADLQLEAAGGAESGFRLMPECNGSVPLTVRVTVRERDGELTVASRIDREQLCGQQEPCLLLLDVVSFSRDRFLLIHVEIQVLDINDHWPEFPHSHIELEISESSAPGTRLPLPAARDADTGSHSVRGYELSVNGHLELELPPGAGPGPGAGEQPLPLLVLVKPLDRETQDELKLQLRARDGGEPPRSGDARLTVRVLDDNDNAPAFESGSLELELPEDTAPGSVLLQLEARDPDQGANGELRYSFSPRLEAAARRLFRLEPRSGRLSLHAPLDHEARDRFELEVEARDLGARPRASSCRVTVRVLDVNDNAPEIRVSALWPGLAGTSTGTGTSEAAAASGLASITEAAEPGSFVALVSVWDRDSGANGRLSVSLLGPRQLELRAAYGNNHHMILTAERLDRERHSDYNVTLVAEDQGPEPRRTVRPFTVTDVNDNAPAFPRSVYRLSLAENNPPGAQLGTVRARDPDLGVNGRLTYRLLQQREPGPGPGPGRGPGPEPGPGLQPPAVAVEPHSGSLLALRPLDREELPELELLLQATDGGSPPLSGSTTVRLVITDRNDNAPLITHPPGPLPAPAPGPGPAPPGNRSAAAASAAKMALPGGAPRGYLAARVRAQDPDEGPNGRLSYRIVSGEPPGLFTIRSDTGEVYLGRPLPPPVSPGAGPGALRLVVAVSDGGLPSLSSTVTLSFTVGPEPPPEAPAAAAASPGPGQRSWDTSFTVIAVLAAGCVALLLAIVGIASSCGTGGKTGREGDAARAPAPAPAPAPGELEADGASEEAAKGVCLLETQRQLTANTQESFMPEPGVNHGAFCTVAFHQDSKTIAYPGQDVFSGKDSGKGDSDFNDSDSDLSGDGSRKGHTIIDQKQNDVFPCHKSQTPCSSNPYYNLTSQTTECGKFSSHSKPSQMVAYSSMPTTLLHSSSGEVTSVLQDPSLKYTRQYGHVTRLESQTSESVLSRESGRTGSSFHPPVIQRSIKATSSAYNTSGHRYQTSYLNTAHSEVATSF